MRSIFQRGIGVRALNFGLAIWPNLEISHIARMVSVGTIETVLLAVRVKVAARGFKVRALTLRHLMEVDRMFTGSEIVQIQLECDARIFVPKENAAYALPLGVFHFNCGLGSAVDWESEQRKGQSEYGHGEMLHRLTLPTLLQAL